MSVDWNVVGSVSGVLALVIAIAIYFLQRQKKILEFRSWTIPIAQTQPGRADKLKIVYNNLTVPGVFVTWVTLRNAGNQPIAPSDFVEPLLISLGRLEIVFDATVSFMGEKPRSIEPGAFSVEIPRMLLNAGEKIEVTIASTDPRPPTITGRIIGTELRPAGSLPPNWEAGALGVVLLISGTMSLWPVASWIGVFGLYAGGIGIGFLIAGVTAALRRARVLSKAKGLHVGRQVGE